MHRLGIVHRDLKLENVMMSDTSETATPKIVDFGLSKMIGPSQMTNEPFGTLGYVAPEVLNKEAYSFTCDVWSLGCITYALLSGSLPYESEDRSELVRQILETPIVFDLTVWNTITVQCKNLVQGLLKKCPDARLTLD